jgi:hypothetical protein
LAAKLTGWNIDILSNDESQVEAVAEAAPADIEDSLIDTIDKTAEINPTMSEEVTDGQTDPLSGRGE